MTYSLGIDAGGSYTDAVLIRDEDGIVVSSGKALTTYPDPVGGIRNALDMLDAGLLSDVRVVSVSTTFSTNTILENTGFPVGLIIVGKYRIPETLPAQYYCLVEGGHDGNGDEICPLDMGSVRRFAENVKDRVSAFAVSSLFSTRNAGHEIRIKEEISGITGLPVVCGHELSRDLGAYERAVTAFLNAQLIPVAHRFTEAVREEMTARGIDAVLLMMKCDGSVVSIEEAPEKPIETIFSGPAAGLMGASYLSGTDTCVMIDIGGTSTDVALIRNGLPQMSETGAVVGGRMTHVRAVYTKTTATGGDSHVFMSPGINSRMMLGPHRVMPVCRAAVLYPGFSEKLIRTGNPGKKYLSEFIFPTVFFLKTDLLPAELLPVEKKHYDLISSVFPTSWEDLMKRLGAMPFSSALESLFRKKLIRLIGFTPTDALHIQGAYTEWDRAASFAAAEKMKRLTHMTPEELAAAVRKAVAINMTAALISYLVPELPEKDVRRVLSGNRDTTFAVSIPVVLIGGPASVYAADIREMIRAEVIAPADGPLGNAIGTLSGKNISRREILITARRSQESEDKKSTSFNVFCSGKRYTFSSYQEACLYAQDLGRTDVTGRLIKAGLKEKDILISFTQKCLQAAGQDGDPIETKMTFVAVGNTPRRRS